MMEVSNTFKKSDLTQKRFERRGNGSEKRYFCCKKGERCKFGRFPGFLKLVRKRTWDVYNHYQDERFLLMDL
jgi:hypothetical protein